MSRGYMCQSSWMCLVLCFASVLSSDDTVIWMHSRPMCPSYMHIYIGTPLRQCLAVFAISGDIGYIGRRDYMESVSATSTVAALIGSEMVTFRVYEFLPTDTHNPVSVALSLCPDACAVVPIGYASGIWAPWRWTAYTYTPRKVVLHRRMLPRHVRGVVVVRGVGSARCMVRYGGVRTRIVVAMFVNTTSTHSTLVADGSVFVARIRSVVGHVCTTHACIICGTGFVVRAGAVPIRRVVSAWQYSVTIGTNRLYRSMITMDIVSRTMVVADWITVPHSTVLFLSFVFSVSIVLYTILLVAISILMHSPPSWLYGGESNGYGQTIVSVVLCAAYMLRVIIFCPGGYESVVDVVGDEWACVLVAIGIIRVATYGAWAVAVVSVSTVHITNGNVDVVDIACIHIIGAMYGAIVAIGHSLWVCALVVLYEGGTHALVALVYSAYVMSKVVVGMYVIHASSHMRACMIIDVAVELIIACGCVFPFHILASFPSHPWPFASAVALAGVCVAIPYGGIRIAANRVPRGGNGA